MCTLLQWQEPYKALLVQGTVNRGVTDLARRADLLAWGDSLPCSSMWLRHHFIFLHAITMQLPFPICHALTWAIGTIPTAPITSKGTPTVLPFVFSWLKGKVAVGFSCIAAGQ